MLVLFPSGLAFTPGLRHRFSVQSLVGSKLLEIKPAKIASYQPDTSGMYNANGVICPLTRW
jgi:hypothetical protein